MPADAPVMSAGPAAGDLERDIVVVGIARNCAGTLDATVRTLAAALPPFRRVRWWVVESDSSDATVAVLQQLAATVPGFGFRSLGALQQRLPLRTQRIAACRNAYLELLRDDPDRGRTSHVVVADMDGINSLLTPEAVLSCWARDDWTACTANPAGPYYDIWALRHPQWCPGDCWRESEFIGRYSGNIDSARLAAVYARMVPIPRDAAWIEVDSAFGGFAIYRSEALLAAHYEGLTPDGAEVCEHVALNLQIRANGGRIFINPALVNAPGADLRQYWPERALVGDCTDSLLFRALLFLAYGKRRAKALRRMIKTVL